MMRKTRCTRLAVAALLAAASPGCATTTRAPIAAEQEALLSALDDEYRAEAMYEAVIQRFGEVRPFVNIIEAERRHAAMAKAEMDRLLIPYPATNPHRGRLAAPASLLEACQQGITAERENIALYDRLLPTILDNQVRETLTALQRASRERHLPAFERCVSRGGVMGPGGGRRGHGAGRQD